MTQGAAPRVLMIAQWPTIKNAEYELIERVRHTGFKITVVDFLGFDVDTGKCINGATLCDEYDFAVSLHYETPKFLNLPTFHWVANPLEFIQAQGNYRTHLIHHLRSYDDYAYNGSEFLKHHIRDILGAEFVDGGLSFFQSCSRKALIAPRAPGKGGESAGKLFYCGVNWEAISDRAGRAQGLLEILQERQLADFYGPTSVLGVNVWGGFPSYRGEIPFDGKSMFPSMHGYAAVLALSSPAHVKSKTSSGRVLEGFAAGVPVISDDNHHVRSQFGDLVYYFEGSKERERADSIQEALDAIRARPGEAVERVREAQALISREYCFEVCLERAREAIERGRKPHAIASAAALSGREADRVVDVFLFFHDPYAPDKKPREPFANLDHLARAMASLSSRDGVRFRVLCCEPIDAPRDLAPEGAASVQWVQVTDAAVRSSQWSGLRLGEKLARLASLATGDFAVFLTQFDYPHHDYFVKTLEWFSRANRDAAPALHIAGFFVNDFRSTAPMSAGGIVRCSASTGLYRWTQNSIAEHHLTQFCFNRSALRAMNWKRLERFDVLLPVSVVLECRSQDFVIHRARHLLARSLHSYYHRYHDAFSLASGKGLWAKHYDLLSNATHEINGLYDVFHEFPEGVAIADRIYGIDIPPPPPPPPPTDPAIYQVAHFLNRISPYVQMVKRVGRVFGIKGR